MHGNWGDANQIAALLLAVWVRWSYAWKSDTTSIHRMLAGTLSHGWWDNKDMAPRDSHFLTKRISLITQFSDSILWHLLKAVEIICLHTHTHNFVHACIGALVKIANSWEQWKYELINYSRSIWTTLQCSKEVIL